MDEAGIYAWILILLFFAVYAFLQIRNCIRDVRGNVTGSFADLHPSIGDSAQANSSSVYSIDMNGTNQQTDTRPAFSNQGYLVTENSRKENDGLPTYEEAIGKVSYPVLPAQDMTENTEMEGTTEQNNDENSSSRPVHTTRRHRRHHRRHFVRMDGSPDGEVDENDGATHAGRRHRRHGRGPGLGRKLAKLNRKRNRNNDSQS